MFESMNVRIKVTTTHIKPTVIVLFPPNFLPINPAGIAKIININEKNPKMRAPVLSLIPI